MDNTRVNPPFGYDQVNTDFDGGSNTRQNFYNL